MKDFAERLGVLHESILSIKEKLDAEPSSRTAREALQEFESKLWMSIPEFMENYKQVVHGLSEVRAARLELFTSQQDLVRAIATRRTNRGLSMRDLVREGNKGLMQAMDRFDSRRGYQFSTYATWWIREAITLALEKVSEPDSGTQD